MEKSLKSFDGTKISYNYFSGDIPSTLVFLHGVGSNWTIWKKEIEFFQKKGFSTLAVDFRGHGKSETPLKFERYKLPYFSRDIHAIITKEKISNFSMIGHSLGGGVAINYCMCYPKSLPTSMILVESASIYPFDHNRLLNLKPYLINLIRFIIKHKSLGKEHFSPLQEKDFSQKGQNSKIFLISQLFHLASLKTIIRTLDQVEAYVFKNKKKIHQMLRKLQIPVLLIAGENDEIINSSYSLLIKKQVQNSELRILKGAHHQVTVENAEEVSVAMQNFLSKQII